MNPRAQQTSAQLRAARVLGLRKRRRRIPRQLPPTMVWRAYATAILEFYARVRAAFRPLLAEMPDLVAGAAAERARHVRDRLDAGEGRRARELLDAAATTMRAAVRPAALEDLAAQMGERTSQHQRRELEKQARAALGVDPYIREPGLRERLEGFAHENATLIEGLAEETRAGIGNIVMRGLSTGRTAEDIGAEIDQRFALGETRCKRIARDQVGSLAGQLNATRQQALGVTSFIWRTVHDDRVRGDPAGKYPRAEPSHFDRDGKVFSYAEPPEDGLPGEPINCRCYAEPDFSDILGEG